MPYKDPEKRKECDRRRHAANPERKKENERKWYAKNIEKQRAAKRKWYAAHTAKQRECDNNWKAKHPEKAAEYARKYRTQNEAKVRAAERKYRKENRHTQRAHEDKRRALKHDAFVGDIDLEFVWNRDKGICYLCGNAIAPAKCDFDHVIPLSKGGAHSTDNLRPTHPKCNRIKSDKIIDVEQVSIWKQLRFWER